MNAAADKDTIAALIPHAGSMVLLDRVLDWDAATIRCATDTHRDPANPLRADGRLAAVHLVEYGAQAMAVHGGLSARASGGDGAGPGLLVTVRNVELAVDRVDDIDGALTVCATRLVANAGGRMYAFEVTDAAGRRLAAGRVGVLPAGSPPAG